jgi:hypothetical protein
MTSKSGTILARGHFLGPCYVLISYLQIPILQSKGLIRNGLIRSMSFLQHQRVPKRIHTIAIYLSYSLYEVPPKFYFIFGNESFDWPITEKTKLWRLPKVEGSVLKYRVPPLWPTYVDERRTKFAKSYEIKVSCYWELFGEHVRNWGTLCFNTHQTMKIRLWVVCFWLFLQDVHMKLQIL